MKVEQIEVSKYEPMPVKTLVELSKDKDVYVLYYIHQKIGDMVVEGMRLKPLGKIMETITNVGLYNMTMRLQVGREALVRISWAQ